MERNRRHYQRNGINERLQEAQANVQKLDPQHVFRQSFHGSEFMELAESCCFHRLKDQSLVLYHSKNTFMMTWLTRETPSPISIFPSYFALHPHAAPDQQVSLP